jgi:hypothetical protein
LSGVYSPFEVALSAFHESAPGAVTPRTIRAGTGIVADFRAWAARVSSDPWLLTRDGPGLRPEQQGVPPEQYAGLPIECAAGERHLSIRGILEATGAEFEWPAPAT